MTRRRAQLARAGYFSDIILRIRFTPEILPKLEPTDGLSLPPDLDLC